MLLETKEKYERGIRGYTDGQKWVPSVSEILEILSPLPQTWVDDEGLQAGSMLHRALFLASRGQNPALELATFPRAKAALTWLKDEGFRVVESERHRTARAGYGGKPDGLFKAKRNRHYVVDFKFAEGIVARYLVQLELYRRLDFGLRSLPDMLLLQINKKCEVKPKWLRPNPAHYAAGLNALNVLRWRMNHG